MCFVTLLDVGRKRGENSIPFQEFCRLKKKKAGPTWRGVNLDSRPLLNFQHGSPLKAAKVHKFTRSDDPMTLEAAPLVASRQASTFLGAETQCTVAAVDEAQNVIAWRNGARIPTEGINEAWCLCQASGLLLLDGRWLPGCEGGVALTEDCFFFSGIFVCSQVGIGSGRR